MRSPGRLATISLLICSSFVLASLERLIPNPFPMIRFGLGNIMTLAAFALFGIEAGIWVTGGRVVLVALIWGGMLSPTAVLSIAGGAASLLAMIAVMSIRGRFSLFGVSVAGAYAHVAAQIAVASVLYVRSLDLFRILPVLGGIGLLTGILNGAVAQILVEKMEGRLDQHGGSREPGVRIR
ncbi:MAG: Gx transporter family protein [bacterium]|nr:MAG: Gx transporter family protein [bacterium]